MNRETRNIEGGGEEGKETEERGARGEERRRTLICTPSRLYWFNSAIALFASALV